MTRITDARPPLGAVPVRRTARPPLGAVPVRRTARPPLPKISSPDGRKFRFAVAVSEFNAPITERLLSACRRTLKSCGVSDRSVDVVRVPGSFELPFTAQALARGGKYHAVIALGCILRGETPHDRYLAQEVARGLGEVALKTSVPVIFGVLTPLTLKQARARSGKGPLNKGRETALAALRMANLLKKLKVLSGK